MNSIEKQTKKSTITSKSLDELSSLFESPADFENKSHILVAEQEEINKDNIWSYTLINVFSCTICLVSIFLVETINLSFVGYTEDSEINLSAIGVGNILLNFSSLFVAFGSLGALDTVGSFCFGQKDFVGLGVSTLRMRILIMICFCVISIPTCIFTTHILESLGISSIVATRSGEYTYYMIPAIFFVFNFNLNVRYLQVMHDYFTVSVIAVFGVIFHYVLNYIIFSYYNASYIAVAYTSCITMIIVFLLSTIYILCFSKERSSIIFYHENLFKQREFWFFTKLAFFSALQHYGDFIGYEIIAFLGNYLHHHESNAASLIVLNYTVITSYVYAGSSYPLGQIVGYCLGKKDESFYKYVCVTYAKLNAFIGISITAFTLYFKRDILFFYTNYEKIVDLASPVLVLYSYFLNIDCFNVMMQSILRGSGNQYVPSVWNILSTIFITIPVSYFFTFSMGFGIIGLWIGIFCFMSFMLVISSMYVYRLDFKEESERLQKELNGITSNDETKVHLLDGYVTEELSNK
jgi:multidrug resistance protein, MATE family